ncbi:MAG: type I methionyl aminopeptidase [Candidatus Margulisiibacteriota bacterium]
MIPIKTEADLAIMREGGKILARVFEAVEKEIRVGVNAGFLDTKVQEIIASYGAKPSFLGYKGYKHATCISKNEEVVHGIPYPDKVLYPGDICSIDIGVYFKGFHVDAARTFPVGDVTPEVQHLITVTKESFFKAVAFAKEGNRLGDISAALQGHVESEGLSVVRDLFSHGVGKSLHEEPLIPNFGKPNKGPTLKTGMTFAIEPMVNLGDYRVLTLPDKWTIIAADRKWSAHYENTIAVGESGPEILTVL